jgi:hypothetical protein
MIYDVKFEFIGKCNGKKWSKKMQYTLSDAQLEKNDGNFYTKQVEEECKKDCADYFHKKLKTDSHDSVEYIGGMSTSTVEPVDVKCILNTAFKVN